MSTWRINNKAHLTKQNHIWCDEFWAEVNGKSHKTNEVDFNVSLTQCLRCWCFFSSCAIHKRNNLFSADISWKATARGKNLQSYIVTADFISRASTTSPGSTFEENFLFTVFVFFVVVPISPGKWKVMQKIFDELSITSGAIAPLLIAFSVFTESSVNRWNWGII